MPTEILKPAHWRRPSGYSNGIAVTGRQVFIAGQVGWDAEGRFASAKLADQVRQALQNVLTVLAEARGGPEHIVRLTWYLTSRDEYMADLEGIGAAYRDVMGKNYPVMSVVQVVALMEAAAKVEIEATAVLTPSTATEGITAAGAEAEIEVFDIALDDIVNPQTR
jgi:enamine deaminase RidA (YjgF/YER057c/UK114 family)